MDTVELDELERLERAATPAPWTSWVEGRDHWSGENFIGGPTRSDPDIYVRIRVEDGGWHPASVADQDFIAAARNALPRLIDEVRRSRAAHGDSDRL